MKVYIPFNMLIDTDFGIIRIVEKFTKIDEYPVNKVKSFLLNRTKENPIYEYRDIRNIVCSNYIYDLVLKKYYENILPLSEITDLILFVINTYKLGLSSELEITIGCDYECEIKYLNKVLSSLDFPINIDENINIKLKDFDCIFIKYLDEDYADYLLEVAKLSAKKIYVADYNFNTIYDEENDTRIIDPIIHMKLESEGNMLYTVSLYNKKPKGDKK